MTNEEMKKQWEKARMDIACLACTQALQKKTQEELEWHSVSYSARRQWNNSLEGFAYYCAQEAEKNRFRK